jgi:lysophospholipase L1-like esterase
MRNAKADAHEDADAYADANANADADADADANADEDASADAGIAARAPKHYRSVLHAGDSFTGALGLALGKKFVAEGSAFHKDVWVSVAISTFSKERRFAEQIKRWDPDLVILTLGANDLDDEHPQTQAAHVRAIVAAVGARDCYWIAPATWKKDTGVVDVIARSCAPCTFFDSRGLKVARKDGIHPTLEGGAVWANRFWEFFDARRRQ